MGTAGGSFNPKGVLGYFTETAGETHCFRNSHEMSSFFIEFFVYFTKAGHCVWSLWRPEIQIATHTQITFDCTSLCWSLKVRLIVHRSQRYISQIMAFCKRGHLHSYRCACNLCWIHSLWRIGTRIPECATLWDIHIIVRSDILTWEIDSWWPAGGTCAIVGVLRAAAAATSASQQRAPRTLPACHVGRHIARPTTKLPS